MRPRERFKTGDAQYTYLRMGAFRRTLVLVLAVVLVCQGVAASSSVAATTGGLDPDSVLLHVALQENGDATWRVEYRYALDGANESAAFESLRAEVENEPATFEARFRNRLHGTVRAAANQTGRPMRLGPVEVAARTQSVPQSIGIVSYRVRWHGFAATTADGLAAGDALRGFYLAPTTTLTLVWPAQYTLGRTVPEADAVEPTRLTWTGERQFVGDEPNVTLLAATSTMTTTSTPSPTTANDPENAGIPLAPLGVVAIVVAVGTGVMAWRRLTPAGGTPHLVSDEERVLAVLEDAGGRVRQQELAERYDWTASKTSKVVNRMQEADAVKVFRLGRENVVTLPEEGLDND